VSTPYGVAVWLYAMDRHPRSALRAVAAEHLSCGVRWGNGRPPSLTDTSASMSISRSRDMSAVAIGRHCRVGVDLEAVRPRADLPALAELTMGIPERRRWQRVPGRDQDLFFYGTWTCKEAVLKALGLGLSVDLEEVDAQLPLRLPLGVWVPVPVLRLPARRAEPRSVSVFVANLGSHVASIAAVDESQRPAPLQQFGTTVAIGRTRRVSFERSRAL